jgi:hypothetical protein
MKSFLNGSSEKMNVLGRYKKHAIAFSSKMVSGESEWLTKEEVTDRMNDYLDYDTLDLTPYPPQEMRGSLWYGFRLNAFKAGKPERTLLLDGEEETLKAKEALYVDTLYYFENKDTYQFVWDYWTKIECEV